MTGAEVTLLATLLGGALSLTGAFAAQSIAHFREGRALRTAFGAEINGILQISQALRHEEVLSELISRWRAGEDVDAAHFGGDLPEDPIYGSNTGRIGLLGREAADTVLFYTRLGAVRVYLKAIADGQLATMDLPRRAEFMQRGLQLWRETKPLGEQLVLRLLPRPGPSC
jgi:hypothetical protein